MPSTETEQKPENSWFTVTTDEYLNKFIKPQDPSDGSILYHLDSSIFDQIAKEIIATRKGIQFAIYLPENIKAITLELKDICKKKNGTPDSEQIKIAEAQYLEFRRRIIKALEMNDIVVFDLSKKKNTEIRDHNGRMTIIETGSVARRPGIFYKLKYTQPSDSKANLEDLAVEKAVYVPKDHPNLVRETVLREGNYSYTISNWQEHLTILKEQIAQLTPVQIVVCIGEIMSGLKAIHDRGIAHNDLSLSNIMSVMDQVTKSQIAKIFDFEMFSTNPEQTVGAAPIYWEKHYYEYDESSCFQNKVTASDIFSLGLIIYVLIQYLKHQDISEQGQFLKSHENTDKERSTATNITQEQAIHNSLKTNLPGAPEEFLNLIFAMTQFDRSQRPNIDQVIFRFNEMQQILLTYAESLKTPGNNPS